jgi:microcystin degradation protein MlrC
MHAWANWHLLGRPNRFRARALQGDLLEKVRAVVGPRCPVVASYDIHAHLTPAMCAHADATVFFHTSPHVDIVETGVRSAGVLGALLGGATTSSSCTPAHFRF